MLASATAVRSRTQFGVQKRVLFRKLSLTVSHAALVVVDSARASNEASTVFAL